MATFKTTDIANLDASPPVKAPVGRNGGRVRICMGTHEFTAAYTTGDILRFARLPTQARLISAIFNWDDLNSSTLPAEVGLYHPVDGAVIDADEFAGTLALGTATTNTSLLESLFEDTGTDISKIGSTLWEWAGLSVDPGGMLDLAVTLGTNGGTTAALTFSWRILYAVD